MKISLKTGERQNVKTFPMAHLSVTAITAVLGAVSTAGALLTVQAFGLTGNVELAAMIVAGVMAFTVAMVPVMIAPVWVEAGPIGKVFGLILAAGFMSVDAGLQVNAVTQFNSLIGGNATITMQTDLADLDQRIKSLPTATELCSPASGEYVGPQRCQQRKLAVASDRKDLGTQRAALVDQMEAAAPSLPPLAIFIALLIASMFQVSSFCARAWICSVTNRMAAKVAETETPVSKTGKTYTEKGVKALTTKAVNAALAEERKKSQGLRVVGSN